MSSLVRLQSVHFNYENLKTEIISGLSLGFHPGWSSLCGVNGSGKSTLLKLIAGELKPTLGKIEIQGTLVSVPQSTEVAPNELEEFFWDYSKEAIRARKDLGIQDDWASRWDSLSIGERKRLQIAIALSQRPQILLMDEPTNHVDAKTRKVILEALKKYKGLGLLVSHDRLLLNELCLHTYILEWGGLHHYACPYDQAKEQRSQDLSNQSTHRERLKKEQTQIKKSAQSKLEEIAQKKRKLSKRNISSKDHDAKEKIDRAKVSGADFSDSRDREILKRKNERIESKINQLGFNKSYDMGVFFQNIPRVRPVVFEEAEHKLSFLKIQCPEVALHQGDKLAIVGENGAGKSTLLKLWLKGIKQNYAYAPQEFSKSEAQKLSEDLLNLETDVRGKVYTLVSCFGSSPKSLAAGSSPSPGVWQKIMIAKAIVDEVPILILDEPTNHMDLAALEALEEALKAFQGILICISHDKHFVESLCNLELEVKKDGAESKASLKFF